MGVVEIYDPWSLFVFLVPCPSGLSGMSADLRLAEEESSPQFWVCESASTSVSLCLCLCVCVCVCVCLCDRERERAMGPWSELTDRLCSSAGAAFPITTNPLTCTSSHAFLPNYTFTQTRTQQRLEHPAGDTWNFHFGLVFIYAFI